MTDAIAELLMRHELGDFDDRDTIEWTGTTQASADDVTSGPAQRHSSPKLAEAVTWLRDILDGGARRVAAFSRHLCAIAHAKRRPFRSPSWCPRRPCGSRQDGARHAPIVTQAHVRSPRSQPNRSPEPPLREDHVTRVGDARMPPVRQVDHRSGRRHRPLHHMPPRDEAQPMSRADHLTVWLLDQAALRLPREAREGPPNRRPASCHGGEAPPARGLRRPPRGGAARRTSPRAGASPPLRRPTRCHGEDAVTPRAEAVLTQGARSAPGVSLRLC